MSAVSAVCVTLCAVGAGAAMLSALIPQKRTGRVMSFIIGIFIIATIMGAAEALINDIRADLSFTQDAQITEFSDSDLTAAVASETAGYLVEAADELLRSEGIYAEDIRISLRINDSGGIYADRIGIYISEDCSDRSQDIESIIYRNFSKEPDIYVTQREAE